MPPYPYEAVFAVPDVLYALGVRQAIICPGSRSAPLALAFARSAIGYRMVVDERSAAYQAMGQAQQTGKPVVLICTSGTAAVNFAPAIAEAFYQQVPLLVLTADRPPEWTDQQDGQTLRQQQLYGEHVQYFRQLPTDYAHPDASWYLGRVLSEAVATAISSPQGPVHLNFPFREPFYPPESGVKKPKLKYWQNVPAEACAALVANMKQNTKVVAVAGQGSFTSALVDQLKKLKIPLIADVTARGLLADAIPTESFLKHLQPPDLLISFGGPVLSKTLKQWLRKQKIQQHWHLQAAGLPADPFQQLTHCVHQLPEQFFKSFPAVHTDYYSEVRQLLAAAKITITTAAAALPYGELAAVAQAFAALPEGNVVHFANSLSVRYGSSLAPLLPANTTVWSNRGTSGIDGCTSTAVGHALAQPEKLHLLVSGDLAFFYDANALWREQLPTNLRILLLNNSGGSIFSTISGPSTQPELEQIFETPHTMRADTLANHFGLRYLHCYDAATLAQAITSLLRNTTSSPALLEVKSSGAKAKEQWEYWKQVSAV